MEDKKEIMKFLSEFKAEMKSDLSDIVKKQNKEAMKLNNLKKSVVGDKEFKIPGFIDKHERLEAKVDGQHFNLVERLNGHDKQFTHEKISGYKRLLIIFGVGSAGGAGGNWITKLFSGW